MDQNLRNRLLLIASLGLLIAGILFLCLSIFSEPQAAHTFLPGALGCILLAGLLNLLRRQQRGGS